MRSIKRLPGQIISFFLSSGFDLKYTKIGAWLKGSTDVELVEWTVNLDRRSDIGRAASPQNIAPFGEHPLPTYLLPLLLPHKQPSEPKCGSKRGAGRGGDRREHRTGEFKRGSSRGSLCGAKFEPPNTNGCRPSEALAFFLFPGPSVIRMCTRHPESGPVWVGMKSAPRG